MGLIEDIAAERARLAAANARITDDDRAEIGLREQRDSLRAEREKIERVARDLDLARRLDAIRASDPEATFAPLTVQEWPDSFIVRRDGKAHSAWERRITSEKKKGGNDHREAAREYAIAVVVDWNGASIDATEAAARFRKFLEQNTGIVTPITDLAARLNGVFAEERKSGD